MANRIIILDTSDTTETDIIRWIFECVWPFSFLADRGGFVYFIAANDDWLVKKYPLKQSGQRMVIFIVHTVKINTLFNYAMRKIINIQTDTATLVIYDLESLNHRINDDADWWSLPEDEVEEINKGNALFLNLGDDGVYKVHIKHDIDEYTGVLFLKVPSGKVFIGAGEDVTGGDLEPDDSNAISGEFISLKPGSYEVKYKKQGSDILISFAKAIFTKNLLEEGIYL